MTMSLRTVVYLRKSTKDKDEKQIHSIERQMRDIQEHVERWNKLYPPHEQLFFDPEKDLIAEDASAKHPGRPKFGEMVERIRKGKYDVLLCTDLNRLSRNAVDTGTLVQLLEDECLQRVQTRDQRYGTTPTDKFVFSLFLSVSKFENDQRAVSTKSGMANQKSRGETTHRAPLGYVNMGEKKGRRWVDKDPKSFDGVKRLWELMQTGDYTIADIYREAGRLGVTYQTRNGRKQLTETAFRTVFQNRYYLGQVQMTDDDGIVTWVSGKHAAMVTEEQFQRVQIILQGRGYRHQQLTRAPSIEAILSEVLLCGKCTTVTNGIEKQSKMTYEGKVRCTCGHCKHRFPKGVREACPECGEAITASTKIDGHRYYRCCKKRSSEACSHDFYGMGKSAKNVKAEEIEAFLDAQISKLYISDSLFEVLRRQLYTLWLQSNHDLEKQIDALEARKASVVSARRKMRGKILADGVSSTTEQEDVEFLLDDARNSEATLDRQIEELSELEEETFERAWQTLQAMRDAKSVLGDPSMDLEPKRRLILSMVSNLTISDDKWIINWKKPFDTAANVGIVKMAKPKAGAISGGSNLKWLPELDSNQQPPR
jgi:DNA invertase Pin-like site-specific DNA recombinase